MKSLVKILFIAVLLTACGPTAKLRRAERLIAKAELQGAKWKVDTVWNTVEIPVPEVRTDTIFKSAIGDTVRIEKERLKIKYVKLPGDSVFIEGKCEADTVYKKTYYRITKTIEAPPKLKWYDKYAKWLLVIIGALFIYGMLRRR